MITVFIETFYESQRYCVLMQDPSTPAIIDSSSDDSAVQKTNSEGSFVVYILFKYCFSLFTTCLIIIRLKN